MCLARFDAPHGAGAAGRWNGLLEGFLLSKRSALVLSGLLMAGGVGAQMPSLLGALASPTPNYLASMSAPAPMAFVGFTPGNLVVSQVGDGIAALSNAATSVFLKECNPSVGFTGLTVNLPTAVSGSNQQVTNSGTATSEGFVTRSDDGKFLISAGYATNVGTTNVVATTVGRSIAVTDSLGTVDSTTARTMYSNANHRSACSTDGTSLWSAGSNTGEVYNVRGAGTPTTVSATLTNMRVTNIFNGQLYVSAASGTYQGVATIGNGLPTSGTTAPVLLTGFPTASGPGPFDFWFATATVLYVADDRATASGGGLQKWVYYDPDGAGANPLQWYNVYTISSGLTAGLRGICGRLDVNGRPTLYCTTSETTTRIVTITDTGSLTLPAISFSGVAIAPANTAFRGVDFTPANTAPTLDNGQVNNLPSVLPSSTPIGTTVFEMLGNGIAAFDPDTGVWTGIAVNATSGTGGTWQWSQDGGTTWNNIGSAISNTKALLLPAKWNGIDVRVRYLPGAATEIASISYRAWDYSCGTPFGTVATGTPTLPNHYGFDCTNNGGVYAVSSATGTSTVIVDTIPTAIPQSLSVNEDATLPVTLTFTDPDSGQSYQYLISTNPANGSLSGLAPNLTYTPTANYFGSDSFAFRVYDGYLTSTPATIGITINPVNDAPTFTLGANEAIDEDAGAQSVSNFVSSISPGPANESTQTVTMTVDGNTNTALFSVQPTLSGSGTTRTLNYTPAPDAHGSATITIKAQDDGGTANGGDDDSTQTFTITVNSVNDAPSYAKGADQTVDEDCGAQSVVGWATAISAGPADESAQVLTFEVTNNTNPGLFSAGPSVTAAGDLSFTPAADANGTATITLRLKDDGGTANGGVDTSATQTFVITVNSVNDVPSFTKGADQTVDEDSGAASVMGWATAISAGPANESSQVVDFLVTNDNNALFSAQPAVSASGDLTFTPAANANGTCTVSVRIHDDGGTANGGVDTSAAQTFTITVNSVNDAPVLDPVGNKSGSTTHPITFTVTASDLDMTQTLTFSLDAGAPAGASMSSGGVFTWTPTSIQDGDFPVTVRVTDNGSPALSDFETITIHVAPTPIYYLTDLGTNGGSYSRARAVNDNGQVVGEYYPPSSAIAHAFLWQNGVMTDLGTLGGSFSSAFDINASGQIVGSATTSGGLQFAFLYSGGIMTNLGSLGGTVSRAQSINDSGQMTGYSHNAGGQTRAFRYSGGVMTDLGTLGGSYSTGFGINNAGDIVGATVKSGGTACAFRYSGGVMTDISDPTDTYGEAHAINTAGHMAAFFQGPLTSNQLHSFVQIGMARTDLGTLGSYPVLANDMNDSDQVVGRYITGGADRGFVYLDGSIFDLNDLLDMSGSGYTVMEAHGISNDGRIAAIARIPSNDRHAVLLTPINPHAPILDPIGNKTVDELVQLSFVASATDPDPGDSVTFSLGAGAPSGAAITPGGTFTWTPTEAQGPGDYPVTVIVSDVANHQDSETIMVHVDEVNVAPTAGDLSPTCNEDGSVAATLSASDPDLPAQTLTYTVLSAPLHGNLSGTAPNLTYTPDADYFGPDSFTYKVNDSFADSNTATASVTVNPVNDVPSFTKGADQTVDEDSGAASVMGWATAISAGPANESSQVVDFLVTNDNNALFSAQPAVSASGDLTFTPAANANGTATVTVKIHDDGGTANGGVDTSAAQTFTITVNAVNDEPSFVKGADQTVDEDAAAQGVSGWATAISAGPSDESGQALTFNVTNDNNSLFAVQPAVSASGTLTFTPAADAFGVATVSVTLKDDGGTANGGDDTSATQTFTITVNSVNDRPSFSDLGDQACLEDAAAQSVSGWAHTFVFGPANESGQTVDSFIVTNDNNALFSVQPAVSNSGTLTFTPAADANGTATIHVRLKDNGGTANGGDDTSIEHAVTISVTAVNDVPSFTKGADQTVAQDSGAHSVSGWATAISPGPADESSQVVDFLVSNDNNALFSTQPAVSASGTLSFTPAAGMSGSAIVSVRIHDDGGTANGGVDTSAAQTFTITVNANLISDVTTAFPVDLVGPRRAPAAEVGSAGLATSTTDSRELQVYERSAAVVAQDGTFGPFNGAINPPQALYGDFRGAKVMWEVSGPGVGDPDRMLPLDGPIGSATMGQAMEFGYGHQAYRDDDNDGFWAELSLNGSGLYQIRFYTDGSTPLATFTAPNLDNTRFQVSMELNGLGDQCSATIKLMNGTGAGTVSNVGPLALDSFDAMNDTGLFVSMVSFEMDSHAVATVHDVRTTAGANRLYLHADVPWVKSGAAVQYTIGMANLSQPVWGFEHSLELAPGQSFNSGSYTATPFPNWIINPITPALEFQADRSSLWSLNAHLGGVQSWAGTPGSIWIRPQLGKGKLYVDASHHFTAALTTASNVVVIDDTAPSCSISATEGATDVIPGGAPAKVGSVRFVLDAKDLGPGPGGSGLGAWPSASLTLPDTTVVPLQVVAGEGNKFVCTYSVTPSTPCGVATLSVSLVDRAGNVSVTPAAFTINVAQIAVNLQLASFSSSGPVTRGIRLVFGGNGTGSNTPLVIERNIAFSATGFASLVLDATDGVPFNKSGFTAAYAKDPKHTLGKKATMTNGGNSQYSVSLTLTGGNANTDNVIDVLDFGLFASRYGQNLGANTLLGHVGPHPDFSGNGTVGTEDFTFISAGFLISGDSEPGNFQDGGDSGRETVSIREMWQAGVPLPICNKMDQNRDGKLTVKEVQAYWERIR